VGTREGFEGKNVVSLAEIHKVMSQEWFSKGINLAALVSSMSNKILMNSKIKKKLFHLLLIKELFTIPVDDAREFKKMVSKKSSLIRNSSCLPFLK
jgi:PIN domain nuclease of toxin-antitoxin system